MSVIIPSEYIEKVYRWPKTPSELESELKFKMAHSFWWRLTRAVFYQVFWFVLLPHLVFYFLSPGYGQIFAMVLLAVWVLVFVVSVIIVLVEWSENKAKFIDSSLIEKVLNVCFRSTGVSFEVSTDTERSMHILSMSDIKSVSGYVQGGWIWDQDRGVIVETEEGKQFRFVLSLSKSELHKFLSDFVSSLGDMNFPVRGTRKFQV
ncbi:hypothetical protein [Pseudomonas sp. NPDC096950]|uniref:hypothetical protein n=1 Tax=Pseudomonas sp. NPDC096950 TaxID=3364485 RepID=UPI00383A65CA